MPRVKRKSKLRRNEITAAHIFQLLHGLALGGDGFGRLLCYGDKPDHEFDEMRAAWDELRYQLLPAWIAEHPGTRPFAFWKFDAPAIGPRLTVIRPAPDNEREHALLLGGEYTLRMLEISKGYNRPSPEPEHEYLSRHGLLTAAEIAANCDVL